MVKPGRQERGGVFSRGQTDGDGFLWRAWSERVVPRRTSIHSAHGPKCGHFFLRRAPKRRSGNKSAINPKARALTWGRRRPWMETVQPSPPLELLQPLEPLESPLQPSPLDELSPLQPSPLLL